MKLNLASTAWSEIDSRDTHMTTWYVHGGGTLLFQDIGIGRRRGPCIAFRNAN